jgi:hypothetical protein
MRKLDKSKSNSKNKLINHGGKNEKKCMEAFYY